MSYFEIGKAHRTPNYPDVIEKTHVKFLKYLYYLNGSSSGFEVRKEFALTIELLFWFSNER